MHNVLGVSGRSGMGKTTLIEGMLPHFRRAGWVVNVVKHSHHDVLLEPAHKDSARFRQAGAQEVLLSSPYRYSISSELRGSDEPSLDALLKRLKPADLTLVEGYHQIDIPRILVCRSQTCSPNYDPLLSSVIAVVSDDPNMDGIASAPVWPLNVPAEVAQNIMQWCSKEAGVA